MAFGGEEYRYGDDMRDIDWNDRTLQPALHQDL